MIKDFKLFWKKHGPFKFALTSAEFPPVLIKPEEWIFSNSITSLLKELMQWEVRKMKLVKAPFSKKKTNILKPEDLIAWKINNFPKEWEASICNCFTPLGHLTETINSYIDISNNDSIEKEDIEKAFFLSLEIEIDTIGYTLLKPDPIISSEEIAFLEDYLREWEDDESIY